MSVWKELEAKREAALQTQIQDGRGRKSLVVSAAERLQEDVRNGEIGQPGMVVTRQIRTRLGRKAAEKFAEVQDANLRKAGYDMDLYHVYIDVDTSINKLEVCLAYRIPDHTESD